MTPDTVGLGGAFVEEDLAPSGRRFDRGLDRLAVETVARAWLMRAQGPALRCASYRDSGGCVVTLRVERSMWPPYPEAWVANAMALVEETSDGRLEAGGFACSEDLGLIAIGFRGDLPRRRRTDAA